MLKTLIVIPCFNEANRLNVRTFQRYVDEQPEFGFLFVNDGSTDSTLSIVQQFAAVNPDRVSVLNLPENQGKAAAVQMGITHAIKQNPQYVGFWDADLATPLYEIDAFAEVLDKRPELQVVIGSRIGLLGRKIRRTRIRRVLGRLFAFAATSVLSLRVRDTQCGAKMFRVSSEIDSIFAEPFHSKWILDVEILARLIALRQQEGLPSADQTIYEKPLESWHDVAGSKLKSFDFVRAAFELAAIYWRCLGPFRQPIAVHSPVQQPISILQSTQKKPESQFDLPQKNILPINDSIPETLPFPTPSTVGKREAA